MINSNGDHEWDYLIELEDSVATSYYMPVGIEVQVGYTIILMKHTSLTAKPLMIAALVHSDKDAPITHVLRTFGGSSDVHTVIATNFGELFSFVLVKTATETKII